MEKLPWKIIKSNFSRVINKHDYNINTWGKIEVQNARLDKNVKKPHYIFLLT